MCANINVAAMRAYDLTMNLGVPNLNLPQVIFLLAMYGKGIGRKSEFSISRLRGVARIKTNMAEAAKIPISGQLSSALTGVPPSATVYALLCF
jgi:hypothetical protein